MCKIKDLPAACAGIAFGIMLFLYSQATKWLPVLLHVFTAFIIFQLHGIFFGFLALLCPFVAEAYTFVRFWIEIGFMNYYTLAIAVMTGLYTLPFLVFSLIAKFSSDRK